MLRLAILPGAFIVSALFPTAPNAPKAAITRVADLRTARSVHTATAIGEGRILIAGGMNGSGGGIASAEIFDAASNRASRTADMSVARSGHTATLLADGRVLIAGGYNGSYENSIEVFDPRTMRFAPAGTMKEGRSGHTAVLLPNGRVVFIGGVGPGWTFLRSAEVYDPATGRSQVVGFMASSRESHTATLLTDGRILVTGGHTGRREAMEVFASAEVFDPATGAFSAAGALVIPRHKHDAIRLGDGRVLIVGGADRTDRHYFETTELYDPRTRSFSRGPAMANSRYKIIGTSALLPNGDVLVTSGARTAELLDTRTMSFSEVAGTFPDSYRFAAATTLSSGDVFIIGGYAGSVAATGGIWRFRQ